MKLTPSPVILTVTVLVISTLALACSSSAGRNSRVVSESVLIPYGECCARPASSENAETGPIDVLAARDQLDYVSWFIDSFTPTDDWTRENLPKAIKGDSHPGFFVYATITEGFTYESTKGRVLYQEKECPLVECYSANLSLVDDEGHVIWRSKSPFINLPVYPFEVGNKLLFLGSRGPITKLYSVDLTSGKIRGFSPAEDVQLEGSAPLLFPPFYLGGYVCTSEKMVREQDATTKTVVVTNEPRTVLMKLQDDPS